MADKVKKKTDQELKRLEKEIHSTYSTAYSELSEKWSKYMESHEKKLDALYDDLEKAKKSGNRDDIKKAQEKYESAVKNVTLNDERYKAMVDETCAKMSHVNEIAVNYVNNYTLKVYTINYNAFADEKIKGYKFDLVNENAVKNLIKTGDLALYKHVDVSKDKAWNEKFINSQVLQGILQGESIDKIAKRVFPEINRFNEDPNIVKRNENSSIRIARTMFTAAENKGRQDSFEKAQSDGVIMERKWVAAYEPGRTRDWHLELNGVIVGVDEPFENSVGKIMYPGDPDADPSNVYNCRCAIRAIVKGFKWNQKEESEGIDSKEQTGKSKSTQPAAASTVVQGKDISDTWVRRPDKFNFEIEDVINAQGFDGLPRVVDAEEFDRYVQESNFIAQRGYTAPDQETLTEYQDALYSGKWYVDCSKGASQYGKGMYSFYTDNTSLTDEMVQSAKNYAGDGSIKIGQVETFTLATDSRIINYNDLLKEQREWSKVDKYFDLASPYAKSEEEKAYIVYNSGGRKALSDEQLKMAKTFDNNITEQRYYELEDVIKIIRDTKIDTSEYAVMKGYDAIKVDEQGYAIILNRTKVIFKKEG